MAEASVWAVGKLKMTHPSPVSSFPLKSMTVAMQGCHLYFSLVAQRDCFPVKANSGACFLQVPRGVDCSKGFNTGSVDGTVSDHKLCKLSEFSDSVLSAETRQCTGSKPC